MFISSSRSITISYLLDLIRLDPARFLFKVSENTAIISNPVYQPQILRIIQHQNNADLFQHLIEEYGETLATARLDGNTILHIACIQVWEKSVRWILTRYPEMCLVQNDRGLEPFWEAFYACGYDVINSNLRKKYFHDEALITLFHLNPNVARTRSTFFLIPVSKPGWHLFAENWKDAPDSRLLLNPTTKQLIQAEIQTQIPEKTKNPSIEHSAINVFYTNSLELWRAFTKHRPDILFSTQNTAKMFYASFRVSGIASDIHTSLTLPTVSNTLCPVLDKLSLNE